MNAAYSAARERVTHLRSLQSQMWDSPRAKKLARDLCSTTEIDSRLCQRIRDQVATRTANAQLRTQQLATASSAWDKGVHGTDVLFKEPCRVEMACLAYVS